MARRIEVKTIPISVKHHARIKKIAEIRKQSIFIILEEIIDEYYKSIFDEQNDIE